MRADLKALSEFYSYHYNAAASLQDKILTLTRPAVAYGTWKTEADMFVAGEYAYGIGWKNIPPAGLTKGQRDAWIGGWRAAAS